MRRILISTIVLATALSVAGCSAGSASESSMPAAEGGMQSQPFSPDADAAADAQFDSALSQADREIITTGYATITVDKPVDAAADAISIVEKAGGRVDSRSENAPTDGDQGSASLTLRIPASGLTATIDKLKALGEVEEISLSSQDITTESQDLDARIGALRSSVDRLTALLATAKDTKVLIELETAITERQGNLESMEAQQRSYADQVSMSMIELSLISTEDAPADNPDTFFSGLGAGWDSFVAFISGLLVVTGVLIPWVIFLGIIALIVVVLVRRAVRRASARSGTTPPSAAPVAADAP